MNFINRLKFFSFGFIIGLILLMFFLSGKKTSCSYLPDARVKKDILKKRMIFNNHDSKKDSLMILNAISDGKIDFSKSNTSLEDCKEYFFEDENKLKKIWVIIKNCRDIAEIYDYKILER
tara:strand:- start:9336 stop:9695 length:360 start_codon:yes stop_codon:yes gene_type:complete